MVRFIVDVQLHKLARLLRMAGFDAMLDPSLDDDDLVEIAESEDRVLLTKDKLLLKDEDLTQGADVVANDPFEQLKEILLRFNLQQSLRPLTRCLECNSLITSIAKDKVKNHVPEQIFESMSEFFTCEECHRIYWKGSHYERMQSMIASLQ